MIIHLRASNFYGGPERQVHLHVREARARGLDCGVASYLEDERTPEFLQVIAKDGIPTWSLPVRSAYDPRSRALLRRLLRRTGASILCTHDYRSTVLAALSIQCTGVRWIAFSRGTTRDDLKVRAFQGLEALALRLADHVVAVSNAQKEKVMKWRIPSRRITVTYNAIDIGATAEVRPVDLRKRFGFPCDAIVCVAAGRLSPEKGQRDLIEAAAQAASVMPRLRFVLYGDGGDRDVIQRRISKLGLDGVVLLPGFERNLLSCLAGADMLLLPSHSEGMPNVVLEAMALRVPVVATAVGGVPEVVSPGRTGTLVPSRDPKAMSRGILEIAGNPEAQVFSLTQAQRLLRERHDFAGQCDVLSDLYERTGVARRRHRSLPAMEARGFADAIAARHG